MYRFESPQKLKRFSNNINLLGKGGFGVVYRAVTKAGQNVAVKLINKDQMIRANLTSRVANEVEIHWQLHHPSVLELYNYFEDNDHVYLVMELCQNGELYQTLKRRGPLREPIVRGLLSSVVRGLVYLHSNGIIHRDLKLSNLLLDANFDVKIGDFGLAVKLANSTSEQKTMCGTPNYISPEIVSRLPYGLASDVWSLGCMMVTLLTGSPPFQSQAVKNTLDRVSRVDYTLPDSLSDEAKDLIDRLLQKNPKARLSLSEILKHAFFDHRKQVLKLDREPLLPKKSQGIPEVITKHTVKADHVPKSVANDQGLPSFNTIHLKAMKQSTKHGQVEILESGELILLFHNDPLMMVITSDSSSIFLVDKKVSRPSSFAQSATFTYNRTNLPSSLLKKYRYALKFVELVQTRTPRIIFYSPQAKCMLMENTPPDFEMALYSGIKVLVSNEIMVLKIPLELASQFNLQGFVKSEGTHSLRLPLDTSLDSFQDPFIVKTIKHAQECLKQCLEIDKTAKLDPTSKFPLICKSSHTQIVSHSRTRSPPMSVHPSSMSTFNETREKRSSSPVSHLSGSQKGDRGSKQSPVSHLSVSQKLETGSKSNHAASTLSRTSAKKDELESYYLVNVGWCLRVPEKRSFTLLFNDGVQLLVSTSTQRVEYSDQDTPKETFPIDKKLPDKVKEKLVYFPKFLAFFRKKS